jgi:hypothetical protein
MRHELPRCWPACATPAAVPDGGRTRTDPSPRAPGRAGSGARTRNPAKDGRAPLHQPTSPKEGAVSHPTLPPDRPPSAVITVRAIQAALAVLALTVLALTIAAWPVPDPSQTPAGPVRIVPDTTARPPGYTPVPAGPPCPAVESQDGSR